jgi:hypothetical protein
VLTSPLLILADQVAEATGVSVEWLVVIVDGLLVLATIAAVWSTLWDARKKEAEAKKRDDNEEQYLTRIIQEALNTQMHQTPPPQDIIPEPKAIEPSDPSVADKE